MQPSCQTCGKQFQPVGGDPDRLPLVFDCMCVFCRGCAVQHEAEHVGSSSTNSSGEDEGGSQRIPCLRCKKVRTTPLAELLPSLPHVDAASAGGARSSNPPPITPPTCDVCEEEDATKHCGDCKVKIYCDGCHAIVHKSAKKKGHTSVPIQAHLQQSGGVPSGNLLAQPMCQMHAGEVLIFFCDTCGILVCATCGILEHKSHDLKPMEQASSERKDAIAAEVAKTVVARDEIVAAKTALESVCDQVRQNGKAAKEKVILGFRRVMAEGKQRREALIANVDEAVRFKCGLLEAQVTGADKSSDNATDGIELADATLKMATPTQVLQYKKVLVGGLQRFQNHGLVLKQACSPLVDVALGDALDDIVTQIGTLGVLRTNYADPAASTAAGEGLAAAKVGENAEFVVTAVECMSGNVRTTGGDDVKVLLVAVEGGDGGGGAAAAAAKPASGKRKRSGGGSSGKGRATKKSKTGAAALPAPAAIDTTVVDNGDGTYSCSYTPPVGADAVGGGKWRLEVLLNGKHIVGSPFAIEVRPSANMTNRAFGSVANGEYALSEGGAVASKVKNWTYKGAIADGAGCSPMTSGIHYWELEVLKNDTTNGGWCFGVCRPGIDLNDGEEYLHRRADTWVMYQDNDPGWDNGPDWDSCCSTCAGTGMTLDPKPKLPAGSRIGLLLDLDNGGKDVCATSSPTDKGIHLFYFKSDVIDGNGDPTWHTWSKPG
eukprot:gene24778-biopygen1726